MNFTSLQYFLVAAHELNFTKAAKEIHISQQSLSQHIQNLESELETELFFRKPRLQLTPAGVLLANAGAQMLDIREDTVKRIRTINSNKTSRLRIGISYARAEKLLPHILPKFYMQNPNVLIDLLEGGSEITQPELLRGNLDFIMVVNPEYPIFRQIPLIHEQLYIAISYPLLYKFYGSRTDDIIENMNRNFDFQYLRNIPLVMLKSPSTVRTIFDSRLAEAGITPRIQMETKSVQTCLELAKAGIGATMYPDLFLNQNLSQMKYGNTLFFPIEQYGPLVMCYNPKFPLSEPARIFIRYVQEWLEEMRWTI